MDAKKVKLLYVHNCYWPETGFMSIWLVPDISENLDYSIPQEFGDSERYLKLPPDSTHREPVFEGKNCIKALGPVAVEVAFKQGQHIQRMLEFLGYTVTHDETADD